MLLHHKTYGAGEPLIILHGLFGMLDNWHTLARRFAEDNLVISMDLRNHGRSPHSTEFNYRVMAEDVLETMHHIGMYRAVILGHSMGGKVAMHIATEDPASVSGMISVDIAPRQYSPGHEVVFEALHSITPHRCESRSQAMSNLMTHVEDLGVARFLMKNLKRLEAGGFEWRMNLPVIADRYEEVIAGLDDTAEYDGPALFIRGGNSGYIADEDLEDIKQHFPSATLETIARAGHWVHADAPDELLSLVRQFISSL